MNSPKPVSPKSLYTAAEHLTQTDKGREALKGLEVFFNHATGLDASNALACLTLLDGFFGEWTGSAIEAVREAANPEEKKRRRRRKTAATPSKKKGIPPMSEAPILERVLTAAGERRLAGPTLSAYRRTWMKLVAWTTAEGFDLGALPKEKARAYYEELTNGRSPSHHLQVKAAASFLYKVIDKGTRVTRVNCRHPLF